ncbi:MAG TPA: PAS domain S-box protein [Opitutaceae bacterium]|nr:PAS domain S-box protein [Opitutaceae bacterium]
MTHRLRQFLFGTLRGRLIVSVAAVHAVLMALFVADLTYRQRELLLDRQEEEAVALSQALATSAAGWLASADLAGLQELAEAQLMNREVLFVLLADAHGRVLAHSDSAQRGRYLLDLPQRAEPAVLAKTRDLVDVTAPARLGGRHVGWARIGIGQKRAGATLARITWSGVGYSGIAIALGSLIAWQVGRRITGRLYAVQETINKVRSGETHARSRLTGCDEAAQIAREVNGMLDAVAQRDSALHTSEAKFRGLLEKLRVAVIVHDVATGGRICNRHAEELLGLSEEQIAGRAPLDPAWHLLREDGAVLPETEHPIARVVASRQPLRDNVIGVRRPDRTSDLWILASADPTFAEDERITQVVLSFVDVSERKRTVEQVRQSELLWRTVFAAAEDAILVLDAEFRIVACNAAARTTYGRNLEGLTLPQLRAPAYREQLAQQMERVRATNGARWETFHLRGDGSSFPVEVSIRPFQTDGRQQYVHVVRDVTQRRAAEEAQRRLTRELRAVGNCMATLMRASDEESLLRSICRIVCDEAGYRMAWVGYREQDAAKTIRPVAWAGAEEGYLQLVGFSWAETELGQGPAGVAIRTGKPDCSQSFETDARLARWREQARQRGFRSMIALPLKDAKGIPFGIFTIYSAEIEAFVPAEIQLLEELAGDLAFGITILRERIERRRADEALHQLTAELEKRVEQRTADLQKRSAELRDSQMALVNIVEDLNEQASELAAANEKLKDLDRLKSLFIASMSHELRTPLNSIIGFSSIMLNEWTGPVTAEQKENLAAVLRSGRHLLALINDVIDVSKIEAGKLESAPEEFDLQEVLNETVRTFAAEVEKKQLKMIVRADRHRLSADRRRLLQCLLNLVSNAVKFTEQGSISISAEPAADGRFMVLTVEDTGIGIGEEELTRLFTPFVRLESRLKTVVPGTGLGLYLTRKLAREVMGGDVTCRSVAGQGSAFSLTIPLMEPRRN